MAVNEAWESDKEHARDMLFGFLPMDKEWLEEVIDSCTNEERLTLRADFINKELPRSLFYNYETQDWI